jgi:alpha-tubulin suppressor-like RCC1 family protein
LGPALSIDAAISISVGPRHVCAVDERGAVWCWGENASGQLGVAPTVTPTSATPLRVE